MTNKEYLVCIDTKLKDLKKQFDNHLHHHLLVALALISVTGGAITALIIALLRQ